MRRQLSIAVLAAIFIAGGCGAETQSERLGSTFCADLEDGQSVMNIVGDKADQFDDADDMANTIMRWVAADCPAQLESNYGLRGYLEGAGLDPDNP